jgi:PTH1 family peptidyl-tRNA hydrolase
MNLSGTAVRKVLARERAPLADLLIVLDEMSLPFGKLRMRERGSAGGHNGLRSIIDELGTEDFARLRVGIGGPAKGAVEHVLGDFAHAEQRHLDVVLDAAADAVEAWAKAGPSAAANRWNAWQLEVDEGETPDPAEPSAPTAAPAAASDGQGIVRTTTGWRKLLPEALRGRGGPSQR